MWTTQQRALWITAGILLLIGVMGVVHALRQVPSERQRLIRKQADLSRLIALQEQQTAWLEWVRMMQEAPADAPPPLQDIVPQVLPDLTTDIEPITSAATWPGWQAQRFRLTVESIPLSSIGELLTTLETQRPPWRVVETQISMREEAGRARMILLVEGLSQEAP